MTPAEHTARLTEPIRAALNWQSSLGAPSWTTAGKAVTAALEALSTLEAALADRDARITELERELDEARDARDFLGDEHLKRAVTAEARIQELERQSEQAEAEKNAAMRFAGREAEQRTHAEARIQELERALQQIAGSADSPDTGEARIAREALAGVPPQETSRA